MMTMTSSGDVANQRAIDIRIWGIRTTDGLLVAAIAEDMHRDLLSAFPSDHRYILTEAVAQANHLDTLTPGDVGYPRYEVNNVPIGFRSDRLRLEGYRPDGLWIFYPDDPGNPPTEV